MKSASSGQLPPSLWSATARPGAMTPPLSENKRVDVAIVGAGYTGLVTALRLAEAGISVCVLDAGEPGWGASGRNGGQVIPGLKYDPDQLLQRYGETRGERIIEACGGAADEVFALIREYSIACEASRKGWIQPAVSAVSMKALEHRARQWQQRGIAAEILDRDAVCQRLGTHNYLGGWVDPRAGSLHPLNYARGLAKSALGRGQLPLLPHTPQIGHPALAVNGDATAQGNTVSADRVVLATNGYTDNLWPGLRQTVLAANSFIIATRPLPPDLRKTILPGGEVCSDARRLLLYFKMDAQGRLLLGGRGPFAEPTRAGDWTHLERSMVMLFPQLAGVVVEYRWSGRIALNQSVLPQLHEPQPGLSILMGYNGRGIAMSTMLGKHLAARVAGTDSDFPFPVTPIRSIPFHSLQRLYVAAGITYYRMLDALN